MPDSVHDGMLTTELSSDGFVSLELLPSAVGYCGKNRFTELTRKICMKIDPYCQRQNVGQLLFLEIQRICGIYLISREI